MNENYIKIYCKLQNSSSFDELKDSVERVQIDCLETREPGFETELPELIFGAAPSLCPIDGHDKYVVFE